jgi:hypothetical protein
MFTCAAFMFKFRVNTSIIVISAWGVRLMLLYHHCSKMGEPTVYCIVLWSVIIHVSHTGNITKKQKQMENLEISSSHIGEYDDDNSGMVAIRISETSVYFHETHSDDEGNTHLWNVSLLPWDCMVLHPRKLSSSNSELILISPQPVLGMYSPQKTKGFLYIHTTGHKKWKTYRYIHT